MGGIGEDVLGRSAVDGALDSEAFGGHAVEGGLVDADGSLGARRVVDVDGDYADGVCGVVVELELCPAWGGRSPGQSRARWA